MVAVKRLDTRTVEFTDDEMPVVVRHDALLRQGWPIDKAVLQLQSEFPRVTDKALWEYLAS